LPQLCEQTKFWGGEGIKKFLASQILFLERNELLFLLMGAFGMDVQNAMFHLRQTLHIGSQKWQKIALVTN
jgi:hypothetical protein